MVKKLLSSFFEKESSSSILLFVMAVVSMFWVNSEYELWHQRFVDSFLFIINDALMAVFFLSVGLELKRGYLDGQLSSWKQISLPAFGALGGMLIPALIYLFINIDNSETLRGWATPVATDIAFALGALSIFGNRVPRELKLFLLALAIFDDVGAILIIAFFLSNKFVLIWFFISAGLFLLLFLLNKFFVESLIPYLSIGILLWVCLLKAGIHPTVAGVLLALTIPDNPYKERSVLYRLEHALQPWVAYFIMPLFALANTGFSLQGMTLNSVTSDVVLGITLGLFMGKQAGVLAFCWSLIRLKIAKMPADTTWLAFYGVAVLCGIGFTMSLFLGTLSFEHESAYLAEVRLGVILGSIMSGALGTLMLLIAFFQDRSSVVDKTSFK